jgi:predicted metal-dependent hydrolase
MSSTPTSISRWREHVEVRRSPRARHTRLKIHAHGRLELVVPAAFDERSLPAVLAQHEPWVVRTLERLGLQPGGTAVPAPRRLALAALGEEWGLEYLAADQGRYGCRERGAGVLRLSGGSHWRPALKRWLARKGHSHLLPWLAQVSREVGLPYSGASIRGQRSRWGSCSAARRINLNYALLFLSPELVRYLFIHELCHTRHMNHSPAYWRLVARLEPDYRALDRALRRATGQLPAWLHAPAVEAAGD